MVTFATIALPARSSADSSGFTFSAAGDFGSWGGLTTTLTLLNGTRSNFALALGDLSYGGNTGWANTTEQAWCKKFKNRFPNVEIVAGNHDTGQQSIAEGDINNFTKYCPFTLNTAVTGVYGKQYYFDYPATSPLARFVFISPDLVFVVDGGEHYDYSVNTVRYNWTRAAIDGARAAKIPWVIVAMHKNCIGAGEHTCETGTDILNLLISEKVDLILQAHTHNYERSKQLALNDAACPAIQEHVFISGCVANDATAGPYKQGVGSVVVISGIGGRELDAFNVSNPYAPYFATWMGNNTAGSGNGISTFHVDASQIALQTHVNGTYSDSFTLTRSPESTVLEFVFLALPIAALGAFGLAVVVWRRRTRRKAEDSEH